MPDQKDSNSRASRPSGSVPPVLRKSWGKIKSTFQHKRVIIPLAVLLGLYVTYVVGAWAALSFGGLEALTNKSSSMRLTSNTGYSFWPGHFTLSEGEFVFQDESLTLQVLAKRAELDVSLMEMLRRNVHIKKFHAEGAKYRMRYLPASDPEKHKKRFEAFPTIPGFERPPKRKKKEEKSGKHTLVSVENIDAQLDEVWIMEYRAAGNFHARGDFSLNQDDVRVEPSHVDLSQAETYVGEKKILRMEKCVIDADLGPFPRDAPTGKDIVGSISADIDCKSRTDDLEFIQIYPRKTPIEVTGSVKLDTDFSVKKGQISSGKVMVSEAKTPVIVRSVTLPLTWDATLNVTKPGVVTATGEFSVAGGDEGASVDRLAFDLESSHQLLHQPELDRVSLDVKSLKIHDSQLLKDVTGSTSIPPIQVHSSDLKMSYAPSNDFSFDGRWSASLYQKDFTLGLQGALKAKCQQADAQSQCDELRLDAESFSFRTEGETETISLNVQAEEFIADLPQKMDARFAFEGSNPKALLKHALGLNFLERLGVNLLPFGPMQGTLHLNKKGNTLAGNLARLSTGELNVRGRFVIAESMVSSWFVDTPLGNYGIHQTATGTNFKPLVDKEWYNSCEAKLGMNC